MNDWCGRLREALNDMTRSELSREAGIAPDTFPWH